MKRVPLADSDFDRAAELRSDEAALEQLWQSDSALCFFLSGGDPVMTQAGIGETGTESEAGALVWVSPVLLPQTAKEAAVFLGRDKAGAGLFATDFALIDRSKLGLEKAEAQLFRASLGVLSPALASLVTSARALMHWHNETKFCGLCGGKTRLLEGGWKRQCTQCGHESFPRTDPVAIMLATHGERCLLGRNANWPSGFMSCLAGFVEPGESVEQAACRELYEEAGVIARPEKAQYLFSQPWPFPASLMMGIIVEAETTEISLNDDELEAAQWVTREATRAILAGTNPDIKAPPPSAIAWHIMDAWANEVGAD